MTETNVFQLLLRPGTFSDPLTEVLRNGAWALLARAVEAEVAGLAQLPHRIKANRRWAPAAGAPRASTRTGDHDGHRSGRCALPAGARSCLRRLGTHPLFSRPFHRPTRAARRAWKC